MSKRASAEITVSMAIDVDGAYNAYGPDNSKALDFELNAHVGAKKSGAIVGYRTRNGKPVVQGPNDPFPGFYISETGYSDIRNNNPDDPRRYVNAAEINYTLLAAVAKSAGVQTGDFCVVHSIRTRHTVFAIVGDTGNSKGKEGSLALLQRLGYPFKSGKSGSVDNAEIVVRYFAGSNSSKRFFFTQAELDAAAMELDLDTDFSALHPSDRGTLVLAAAGNTEGDNEAWRVLPFAPVAGKAPVYPGRMIVRDDSDRASVKLIQQRLRDLGYTELGPNQKPRPLSVDGGFGTATEEAVTLFQMRHSDLEGMPLEVDGQVGSATWGALFGRDTVPKATPATAASGLAKAVLEMATSQIGVREKPPGSNKGPEVEAYLSSAGVPKGNAWCAAFVYWCFRNASANLGVQNPAIRTGGVLDSWNKAGDQGIARLTTAQALDDPGKIKPGSVFVMSTGGGNGHTGFVVSVRGSSLETIEGNTNDDGSREGIGVFRRTGRSIASINRGFIEYAA